MYSEILNAVIDNGRVQSSEDGFDRNSLIVEVEFESSERGLSEQETQEAVQFALSHTELDD
jgi:hypothetical protein